MTLQAFRKQPKPHALDKAVTASGLFPSTPQTVSYTGFDKVLKVKQGNDSLVFAYGHDHQRISMEEHVSNTIRTKRYVGACEYVTESSGLFTTERQRTYLSGPSGVFAVVERLNGGADALHYVLKDNLGSWTTITDSDGNVEQRLSYDAWGNLRDPATWSGSFIGTPMFDRGFTGHEHFYDFGLINMNGRMYDPMMSSFLSADRFVQDPSSALGFNRYAYCMYNPLRYVDPTGWLPRQGTSGPHTSGQDFRDIYAYVERPYEPRDFRNPYYECNMSFYGSMGGLSGGAGSGGAYYGSYGYHVAYCSNSVYNYHFLSSMMALIQNWQNNPSRITGSDLLEAGISNLTVGELYGDYQGASGFRNSYYTWTDANGNKHTAKALYEYVGGNKYGVYAVSNQPLEWYGAWSTMDKANIMAQSVGVPMGTITEGMEMAAKSYYNVPLLKIRSGLTQAQRVTALSKEGTTLLRATKGLGRICAGVFCGYYWISNSKLLSSRR
jgi:RHS repeat-associated protein